MYTSTKAKDINVGDTVLFAGKEQIIKKKERTMYGNDFYITLSVSGTGVWGVNDRITKVN